MQEEGKDFHDIALKSILFKGRSDWYFCYLKSEKIAHVLGLLSQSSPFKDIERFQELVSTAGRLPHTIVHFAAGEIDASVVLADVFSLLSVVRLSATQGLIRVENTAILAHEYEYIARKIAAQNHPSPFVSNQDFTVEVVDERSGQHTLSSTGFTRLGTASAGSSGVKDNHKGHNKESDIRSKGQQERLSLILDFVKKNKGVSIKDIAEVVQGCSEKTIQRELASLVQKGLIERKGERRWSMYFPTLSKT